ncbi:unnamed protein product [Echinostoma caproni]|uniref:Neur_chan_memb domain-containing protein n=1 Tax=Echinostoma caproni TaxID=27848 RepID=A0A183ACN1_9TREM|nr:unnamed protein product [Echinostoma caproni]
MYTIDAVVQAANVRIYMTSVMTLTALSVVICVIVINLDSRGEKLLPVPGWLRRLVNLNLIRNMVDHERNPMEAAAKLEHVS